MKISLEWIGEYLKPVPSAQEAADALMNGGLPVESIEQKGDTSVLDVEVTSNRTDCFCHVGLARELSALAGGVFRMPAIPVVDGLGGMAMGAAGGGMGGAMGGGSTAAGVTSVRVQEGAGCSYYTARVIQGVKVGASPEWLRKRLESIGLRSINNVVDVTNYVMMELGQPLHAFDFDKLAEHRIVVRHAREGEKLEAIDGSTYALQPSMLVIADGEKAAAIAGVMGGKATEVTAGTVNILLESARFDPLSVRTTSRALGLRSDSSFRFERGIDPTMADLASRRAAALIVQVAGGEIVKGVAAAGSAGVKSHEVRMRVKRFEEIMGYAISGERALAVLSALGFSPGVDEEEGGRDEVYTRIPPHRLDVDREIDLIEEIARVEGYGCVPILDRVSHPVTPETVRERASKVIMQTVVEAGFHEAVTVTFVGEAEGKALLPVGQALLRPQHGGWKADVLRPSLLGSLLAVRRTNQHVGVADARVFEVGQLFGQAGEAGAAPLQRRVLSAVAGDLAALTGLVRLLADRLNAGLRMWVEPKEFPWLAKAASGEVWMELGGKKQAIGSVGLFTAELLKRYDLKGAAGGLEIGWEEMVGVFEPVRRAVALPRFPGVARDLSVVVEEAVRWAKVREAVLSAGLANLAGVEFVTTFRGKGVAEGKKSLTLAMEFRDAVRTLTSEEVDAEVKKAITALSGGVGATLRT